MNAITTTLIVVAGVLAGCVTPSYHGPGPSTTSTGSATTTYVYTPSDRASCETVGGRWHILSQTCTFPR